eukprot:650236-Rhodomonas_salina.2
MIPLPGRSWKRQSRTGSVPPFLLTGVPVLAAVLTYLAAGCGGDVVCECCRRPRRLVEHLHQVLDVVVRALRADGAGLEEPCQGHPQRLQG